MGLSKSPMKQCVDPFVTLQKRKDMKAEITYWLALGVLEDNTHVLLPGRILQIFCFLSQCKDCFRELGIRTVFVHRFAGKTSFFTSFTQMICLGILSAYGLGLADLVYESQVPLI